MRELLAYSQGAVVEEKLTLRIKADNSGNIYLPISGYSSEGLRDNPYDWKVKIDGGNEVRYTGVGYSGGTIRVGYGLNALSVHTVEVRPQVEDYGWLRAFGYYGTSIASSLINIISDKSYKGYANTEFYTGNWYKAYQYYGCNNLINTDEELLPDTLEIIGDNYRYYEYAGCTSLVHNADEKILKTVKVIGDNYRAYQYQNCTGINKINMRAINWASVGNNYRLNQYSGIGTDRNLVSIYIEGGIEEGGNWGLNNNNIKGIYVYKDLVGDYRTKLSGITSSKIQKNPDWDNFEYEFIEYIGLADSTGKIRIPVGGFSTSFTQNCAYDWMVSIDGGEEEEITGTGGQTYVSVGSGLTEGSEHRVVIKPKTISWGWGRAFGFHTTGAQAYIKEIIHDSYKCYASSRTSTGNHYKHGVFMGCTNLINSYEKLPTSVTSIGTDYMSECYGGCTSLKNAFWEILHKGVSIGNNYRYHQYIGCSAMEIHEGIAGYSGTYPTNYKYEYLSGAGNNMKVYITRYEALASGLSDSMGISSSNLNKIYCYINDLNNYLKSSNWSNVSSKWGVYYYPYICHNAIDINRYTKLVTSVELNTYAYESNIDWYLGNQIYVNKGNSLRNILINGKQETGTSKYEAVFRYSINGNNLGTINRNKWNERVFYISWRYTPYTTPYAVGAYDRWGNYYFAYSYPTSSNDYVAMQLNGWGGSKTGRANGLGAIAVSRNGQFVFCDYGGYKRFTANTLPGTSFTEEDIDEIDGSLMFSEDGYTMYVGNSDNTQLIQYRLDNPRDTTNKTATGNVLNINGRCDMSMDGKYLYRYDGGTIYQYTYE